MLQSLLGPLYSPLPAQHRGMVDGRHSKGVSRLGEGVFGLGPMVASNLLAGSHADVCQVALEKGLGGWRTLQFDLQHSSFP